MIRFGLIFSCFVVLFSCKDQNATVKNNEPISIPAPPPPSKPDSGILFYLTFDDGPYQTTPGLVAKLKELKVKSSFFIVGSQVRHSQYYDSIFNSVKNTDIFKIYNHSYSHAVTNGRIHQYYRYPEKVYEDIRVNKDVIKTGGNITRLPGKNTWRLGDQKIRSDKRTQALIDYMDSNKIKENIVGWDVEWTMLHSNDKKNVDDLFQQVQSIVKRDTSKLKHVVLLSHDYLYRETGSLDNLSYFISRLKDELKCSFHWVEEIDGLFPVEGN